MTIASSATVIESILSLSDFEHLQMAERIERRPVAGSSSLGGGGDDAATNEIGKQIMMNPEVFAALQKQFAEMDVTSSDYNNSLDTVLKRRIKALKKLQAGMNNVECNFFQEVHQLECKYSVMYSPYHQKRYDIITSALEPTDEDCDWPSDDDDDRLIDDIKSRLSMTDKKAVNSGSINGIPDFWLTIIKNVDILASMVQEHDEPVLKSLQDIRLYLNKNTGFTLEFIFDYNEYFNNTSLTKEYFYRFSLDEAYPLGYEGPEIVKCAGCPIEWKKGKNVTIKLIKKVQKHKGRGTKRTVTRSVQTESFFNFFNPPHLSEGEDPDEETEALLAKDFEVGHFIREHIIPRAVLYYTGDAIDEDDDEDDNEGDDYNDDDDYGYEDEEDDRRHHVRNKGYKHDKRNLPV